MMSKLVDKAIELQMMTCLDSLLDRANHDEYLSRIGKKEALKFLEENNKYVEIIKLHLQRLADIDNSSPNEALEKLEMLSDCAEAIKETPSSNWIEYANNETELDLKLWIAYEDLKEYILKAQEQEKVLEIIKEKCVDEIDNVKQCVTYKDYKKLIIEKYSKFNWSKNICWESKEELDSLYLLTEEEYDAVKRYFK